MSGGQLIKIDFKTRKRVKEAEKADASKLVATPQSETVLLTPCLRPKLEVFSELIQQNRVRITFRTADSGVIVPDHLYDNRTESIDWSMLFRLPDFDYDGAGVSGTLSFARQPFHVSIPWSAVIAMGIAFDGGPSSEMHSFWISNPTIVPNHLPQGESNVNANKQSSPRVGANFFESFFFRLGAATKRIFG